MFLDVPFVHFDIVTYLCVCVSVFGVCVVCVSVFMCVCFLLVCVWCVCVCVCCDVHILSYWFLFVYLCFFLAGAQAIYLSGSGVATASYGLPDLGITGLEDVLVDVRRVTRRVM